jgi:hypothetical protein
MTPAATDSTPAMANTAEVTTHLDAIDSILSQAKDGKLSKDETAQIKAHVEQLRQILNKK